MTTITPEKTINQIGENLAFPLVITPQSIAEDPTEWATSHQTSILADLDRHGAILFRGFNLKTPQDFEAFAKGIYPDLYGSYGDLPKKEGGERIYRSTPYPNDLPILFHNESSNQTSWPQKQFFFCEKKSPVGGITPIVDCRAVYRYLPAEIIAEFEAKGLMYIRHFVEGLDVSWQDFFKTESLNVVANKCKDAQVELNFLDDDVIQTKSRGPGIVVHPATGQKSFFNQVQLHHPYCLQPDVREVLLEMVGLDRLPRNVVFGDGTAISDDIMRCVGDAYEACAVREPWQEGDVIMVDNMAVAHARDTFEGERKIVVAMGDMFHYET